MKFNKLKNELEDEIEIKDQYLGFSERSQSFTQIKVYLDEDIKAPRYYRGVVDKVSSLGEGDQAIYYVSSPGGRMDGMISLIEANRETDADILCVIVGECHSAASMFALTCPNISVSPSASMMVHFVSFGAGGIASHVKANVDHTLDFCSNYFRDIYEGFLTEQEMDLCINSGKEIWMQAEEIVQRLENRQKYFKELSEAQSKEEETACINPLEDFENDSLGFNLPGVSEQDIPKSRPKKKSSKI